MAKHLVKCLYCGEPFDASLEPFVKPRANRYAHAKCAEQQEQQKINKEEQDLQELEALIKEIYGYDKLPVLVQKQIQRYRIEKNYSYSAIKNTLYYFYKIRGNSPEQSKGGIGIVEYVIDEAKKYYQAMANLKEVNKQTLEQGYQIQVREVHITEPKVDRMQGFRKLFSFLDEEEVNEQ